MQIQIALPDDVARFLEGKWGNLERIKDDNPRRETNDSRTL